MKQNTEKQDSHITIPFPKQVASEEETTERMVDANQLLNELFDQGSRPTLLASKVRCPQIHREAAY